MSGWRHVDDCGTPDDDPFCGCTTPTPDPTSPCGYRECADPSLRLSLYATPHTCWCEFHEDVDRHPAHHPHIPTRCTCGHAIEEAE